MKQKQAYTAAIVAICAALCAVICGVGALPILPTDGVVTRQKGAPTVLLDAGHGGADGGAVAPDGTAEKDINLAIALKTRAMLRLFGYEVRMTRETDTALGEAEGGSLREQKVRDMHRRLALYDAADMVVSIHQNKFGQARYHGIQVFYSPHHPMSESVGTALRATMLSLLQPDNTRELKRGEDTVFLLYKTTAPAVLVECGFLSNPEELALLKTDAYRQQLAFAITCGILSAAS